MYNFVLGVTKLAIDVGTIKSNHLYNKIKGVPKWENDFSFRILLKTQEDGGKN